MAISYLRQAEVEEAPGPVSLTPAEFNDLVHVIRGGLLEVRATKTCSTIPAGWHYPSDQPKD
jgi:hypothetical protein